jgi:hypothetical protein
MKKFMKDESAQQGTIMAIVTGSILVLLAVFVFANVANVAPAPTLTMTGEDWIFNTADSNTWTKTLNNSNLVTDSVKVYNATWTGTIDTDYTVDYTAGKLTNVSGGGMVNGTYEVDYSYVEASYVTAKATLTTLVYNAFNLVVIGFLVTAAVFILFVVGRLRQGGGGGGGA